MSEGPTTRLVACPDCAAGAVAVVPRHSVLVQDADQADGKVRVNCRDCGERFLAHYQTGSEDH